MRGAFSAETKALCIFILIFGTLFVLFWLGCQKNEREHRQELYYNVSCKIISMNGEDKIVEGKYATPATLKIVLIKCDSLDMYAEIDNREMHDVITESWWYNHRPGDSIFFTKIRKDRFFRIDKK